MSAHKATPDPTPHKEFNPKMQAGLRTYSFANMTAPDKASQLLIQFGVASRIAAPDEQVRASTAFSLGRIGGDRAVELLLTALNDSTDGVRGAAAYALSETGDRRAIEPLERLLKQEKSEPIRQQIETALQQLKARAPRKL